MNGIAKVVIRDGMAGITHVIALPTAAGNPKNTLKSVAANLVNDGLKEVAQRMIRRISRRILNDYGLIGQL